MGRRRFWLAKCQLKQVKGLCCVHLCCRNSGHCFVRNSFKYLQKNIPHHKQSYATVIKANLLTACFIKYGCNKCCIFGNKSSSKPFYMSYMRITLACDVYTDWPPVENSQCTNWRGQWAVRIIECRPLSDSLLHLSLIHIWRCRRIERCRSRWSPYH